MDIQKHSREIQPCRLEACEGMSKKRILIVDDDHKVRATISKILKTKGYKIDEASSGKEAIEKALSNDFDIVLLDLMMPTVSGMDVLVELADFVSNNFYKAYQQLLER